MNSIKDWLIDERQRAYGKLRDLWMLHSGGNDEDSVGIAFSLWGVGYMDDFLEIEGASCQFEVGYIYGLSNTLLEIEAYENNA
jgi:hypothetical protein